MLLLSMFAPLGCVVDCPNCLTEQQVDDKIAAALAAQPAVADLQALEERVTAIEAASYATTGYVDAAVATCATDSDLAELDRRVTDIEAAPYATEGWVAANYQPIGDYLVAADLDDLDSRVSDIENAPYATQSWVSGTYLTSSTAAATYQPIGDYLTTSAAASTYQPVGDYAVSGDVVHVLSADDDLTWTIKEDRTGDYATIADAIAALDGYHIPANLTLTIEIEDGTYEIYETLVFRHPDGGRVNVVGNVAAPTGVMLNIHGTDGIQVREATSLGYLGGLTLQGDATSATGLQVVQSSTAFIGPMNFYDFRYGGVVVSGGSYLDGHTLASGLSVSVVGSGTEGVSVLDGSAAVLPFLTVSGNGVSLTADHMSGISVRGSSYLNAENASSVGNTGPGFYVGRGSFADLAGSNASHNTGAGYTSENSSGIYAYSTDSYDNGDGYVAATSSSLEAWASTSYGNRFGYISTEGSYLNARDSQALESVVNDYLTEQNGIIVATGALGGISAISLDNDVTDFIIGL